MKACICLSLLLSMCRSMVVGQVNWKSAMGRMTWQQDSTAIGIAWNNYSTSFVGDIDKQPLLMVAIPYNGIYGDIEAGANDLHLASPAGLFDFKANPIHTGRTLYTYDSSEIYFMAPGVFSTNARQYEYRVYLDTGQNIQAWGPVKRFTDSNFVLNTLRRGMGFLGGFRADWGHYVTAELREAATKKIISVERVFWKEVRPAVLGVFTTPGLTDFLLHTKGPFDGHANLADAPRASDTLKPENSELIVFVTEEVYRKAALEYRVTLDGKIVRDWGQNEFDNNAIRLKDLAPGTYALDVRYRRQRQNVLTYTFYKEPFWYQRGWVKWGVIGFGLIFGILVARLIVLRRQKKALAETNRKMTAVANELKYIQSQLNPHFIFNALSSIQGLINKGEIGQANDYLSEFSSLLRETLAGDEEGMATLAVELKMLHRYLKLEQLRFNFTSEVEVDPMVQENEVSFPVLLLQPLVENAVKHGVAGMNGTGKIGVLIRTDGDDMEVEIVDNGKGFEVAAKGAGGGRSAKEPKAGALGLKLTRDRIALINQSNPRQRVQMQLESHPGKGTLVSLRFKNWLK